MLNKSKIKREKHDPANNHPSDQASEMSTQAQHIIGYTSLQDPLKALHHQHTSKPAHE